MQKNCYKYQSSVKFKFLLSLMLFFVSTMIGFAQKPVGVFLKDSIVVGQEFDYALSFRHKPEAEVFFPDTTLSFAPFELIRRNYFPTKTENNVSLDSVVYTLRTFDIAQIQRLSMPIYIFSEQDCTAVYSNADSVFLKRMVVEGIENQKFESDTKLQALPPDIDYLKLVRFLISCLIGAMIVYFFFGDYILRRYKLFMFGQRHKEFLNAFNRITKGKLDDQNIAKALVLWKKHLEWLEKKPFTSFTTKEIIENIPNEALEQALRNIDSAIYGGQISTSVLSSMQILKENSIDFYKNKRTHLFDVQQN